MLGHAFTRLTPPAHPPELLALHRLPSISCTSGDCRTIPYWPVDYPQEGLLQLDHAGDAAPVKLFAFSSRGIGVVSRADVPIEPGTDALLITQAHGAGCQYRKVQCCWLHSHPQDALLQCIGLRFVPDSQPPSAEAGVTCDLMGSGGGAQAPIGYFRWSTRSRCSIRKGRDTLSRSAACCVVSSACTGISMTALPWAI